MAIAFRKMNQLQRLLASIKSTNGLQSLKATPKNNEKRQQRRGAINMDVVEKSMRSQLQRLALSNKSKNHNNNRVIEFLICFVCF